MNYVCKENTCTGCMACVNSCLKDAIAIVDNVKHYNAIIDKEKCIDCGKCENVCPNNNTPVFQKPVLWKEGWATCESQRAAGSSGGFAGAISKAFIKNGGYVCSCYFCDGEFIFKIVGNEMEIEDFAGSKYIKSDPQKTYREINNLLKEEKRLLFIGLPCQVAGLKNYIGKNDYLYTIDLICHGTPSPLLLKSYLSQDLGISYEKIEDIIFRQKQSFKMSVEKQPIVPLRVVDRYTFAFLEGIIYTDNCYSCKYAQINRVSDLTLGDSWGSLLPKEEKNKGISLAICYSRKGEILLENADITCFDVDLDKAIQSNHQLRNPSEMPQSRVVFFNSFEKNKSFKKAVFATSPFFFFKQDLKQLLIRLHFMGGG